MRALRISLLALGLCACQATGPVRPFQDTGETQALSDEETRLWHQAAEFDTMLHRSAEIYPDAAVTAYLQDIMNRLFPEFEGSIRVQVVKSPVLNAFALPNGSIYVHIGLIARMDNEAQLATVLAHEGAHFVQKHSLLQQRNLKSSSVFATSLALVGIPLMPELLAASSIYGYSRDLERDADQVGYQRLIAAGYSAQEAGKTFEHLAAEVEALGIDEPFFFSSHPKLSERIDSFRALAGNAEGGALYEERYLNNTAHVRVASLEADLSMGRYDSVILVLDDADVRKKYPTHVDYYRGEAYRRRGEEGDPELAIQAYRAALAAAPQFAASHRGLGILAMKHKQWEEAQSSFNAYLRLAPQAKDRAYIEQYLASIDQQR